LGLPPDCFTFIFNSNLRQTINESYAQTPMRSAARNPALFVSICKLSPTASIKIIEATGISLQMGNRIIMLDSIQQLIAKASRFTTFG
jgi:hypothetical protein